MVLTFSIECASKISSKFEKILFKIDTIVRGPTILDSGVNPKDINKISTTGKNRGGKNKPTISANRTETEGYKWLNTACPLPHWSTANNCCECVPCLNLGCAFFNFDIIFLGKMLLSVNTKKKEILERKNT